MSIKFLSGAVTNVLHPAMFLRTDNNALSEDILIRPRSPNIVKNTAPAKIIPEIPEVLSVEQNQNSEPEQITAAEPTVPLETSQPSALSLGSRINAIFTAAISNIVIQSVSAVISFFKNLKWW